MWRSIVDSRSEKTIRSSAPRNPIHTRCKLPLRVVLISMMAATRLHPLRDRGSLAERESVAPALGFSLFFPFGDIEEVHDYVGSASVWKLIANQRKRDVGEPALSFPRTPQICREAAPRDTEVRGHSCAMVTVSACVCVCLYSWDHWHGWWSLNNVRMSGLLAWDELVPWVLASPAWTSSNESRFVRQDLPRATNGNTDRRGCCLRVVDQESRAWRWSRDGEISGEKRNSRVRGRWYAKQLQRILIGLSAELKGLSEGTAWLVILVDLVRRMLHRAKTARVDSSS